MNKLTKVSLVTGGIITACLLPPYLVYRKLRVALYIALTVLGLYNGITYVAYINNRILLVAAHSESDRKEAKRVLDAIKVMPFLVFDRGDV